MPDALVNKSTNLIRVSLRRQRVGPGTRSVLVGAVTGTVEEAWQRTTRTTCYAPWLFDRSTRGGPLLCNQAVHAPVKVRVDKAVFSKELNNTLVRPVPTLAWPLNEDPSTNFEGVLSNYHKGLPQFLEKCPVEFNLL